jgi:hypothetical protein
MSGESMENLGMTPRRASPLLPGGGTRLEECSRV